jgi:hypothetical protein
MNKAPFPFAFLVLVAIAPMVAGAEQGTLEDYWPLSSPPRSWTLINANEKDSSAPKIRMSVANQNVGTNQFELWFSNKPGQAAGASDVELYRYCGNEGGRPWLFLDSYINAVNGKRERFHVVRSIRILFTPANKPTIDLVADGTYARCGNKGQPYLLWNQDLNSYRIQVWGGLSENPKWKWYWDATIAKSAPVTNDCLKPVQTVNAIKVQEAWWNNFKAPEGNWNQGTGDMGADGLPTGRNVSYGRTVWHAQGQVPYFLTGRPDGRTVGQCANQITAGTDTGH